jgi:myo-inositol 2-dehydrogenase/D-chiro-inositol 1-dehydrogenase
MNRSKKASSDTVTSPSRRKFLQGGGMILAGGAIVGGNLSVARGAHAFGSDTIKLGLVGCGARGTAAAIQALHTSSLGPDGGNVTLVAMADVFENNLHASYRSIKGAHPERVEAHDRRFVGLDAYEQVMQSEADVVILATPPGFRPQHFEAAVAAKKHVFMEKPLATDAPGVRRILAANEIARDQGLAVQVGLQRHHEPRYTDCIDQIQSGAIGELQFATHDTSRLDPIGHEHVLRNEGQREGF